MYLFRRIVFIVFLLFVAFSSKATHNRAGEITYLRIAPFTKVVSGVVVQVYTYSITIIKYTNHGNNIADRCLDTIYFGDGERGIAKRINGVLSNTCCFNQGEFGATAGSIIINDPNYVVKINTYTITHTYAGPGTYKLRSLDPNRNGGIKNIPNSINVPFYVESLLIINAFTGANSSPIFAFAPIDRACKGVCFEHNPGAFDPDGDSLSYELTPSRGSGPLGSNPAIGYYYPSEDGGTFEINAITGLIRWCNPVLIDEYNIAFVVKEWRKNTSGKYELIGYVMRDMQVLVNDCDINKPPSITVPDEVCIEAGKTYTAALTVSDPNDGDFVTVEGGGGAFEANTPLPFFNPKSGFTNNSNGNSFPVYFTWQTTCDHVRSQAYYSTFKVQDNGGSSASLIKLVSFNTLKIKVVPPSIKNVTATPVGTSMRISWTPTNCNPSTNPLLGYKIYRKQDCAPVVFDPCQSGIPNTSAYKLINDTITTNSFYIDSNKGEGLVVGENYSYLVVAIYKDGTQTAASAQVCAALKRDVPVILNVDVKSTSADNGEIEIRWTRPLTNFGNLDTLLNKGPYAFNVKHRKGKSGSFTTVKTFTNNFFLALDTVFLHKDINTSDSDHYYSIEFVSTSNNLGNSQNAGSVFLSAIPSDRRVDLKWEYKTPWKNYKFSVYKKAFSATTYTLIGNTEKLQYSDSINVLNDSNYCYYVVSEGAYSDTSIFKPLLNTSQIVCTIPIDLIPPVIPTLSISGDCASGRVVVTWNDVSNQYRSDDVSQYVLFYKPTINDTYKEIYRVDQGDDRIYVRDDPDSYSGCYAIKAIDIHNNSSALGPDFCIDNCPEFELPNIFSPNKDGANDFFQAIKVKQIQSIDLAVVDRWGHVVYKTSDPYFKWDGISQATKVAVSEGTFFYVCDVYEARLVGPVKRTITGTVQVVR